MEGAGSSRVLLLGVASVLAVLPISHAASAKIVLPGPFNSDGGTVLFPVSHILGEIRREGRG